MLRLTEIKLPLNHNENDIKAQILKRLKTPENELLRYSVFKRSIDARKKNRIVITYSLNVETVKDKKLSLSFQNDPHIRLIQEEGYRFPVQAGTDISERPLIIGAGPAGLFAGLLLAQAGFRPIILERGKQVRERTVDTFEFWRSGKLNPESNVQFGEGGAGTFSDGKLHTQIRDRGHRGRRVLQEFVKAGAPPEILYLSKPHIGTFRLVKVVETLRAEIESLGGEIRCENKVADLLIENQKIRGVRIAGGKEVLSNHIILATGHSARDTFEMLHKRGVYMEPKPFSIGFRIEHPQSHIDQCRFGEEAGHPLLGSADYKLVHHCKNGRSVYTFCMCPGGTVVAAASENGGVVTNGMSQYSRNERNANSAVVVGVTPEDYPQGALGGVEFQRQWEKRAFELGGADYKAPGQLLGDFLANRPSKTFGSVLPSYKPGVKLGNLNTSLPAYAIEALREALPAFDKKIKGFLLEDAVLTGVETRTSSPVRITRGKDFQSVNTQGLYPSGEGAGYAGGILSSAVDGIETAEAVAKNILERNGE